MLLKVKATVRSYITPHSYLIKSEVFLSSQIAEGKPGGGGEYSKGRGLAGFGGGGGWEKRYGEGSDCITGG